MWDEDEENPSNWFKYALVDSVVLVVVVVVGVVGVAVVGVVVLSVVAEIFQRWKLQFSHINLLFFNHLLE